MLPSSFQNPVGRGEKGKLDFYVNSQAELSIRENPGGGGGGLDLYANRHVESSRGNLVREKQEILNITVPHRLFIGTSPRNYLSFDLPESLLNPVID
jgi:hypothetical protein